MLLGTISKGLHWGMNLSLTLKPSIIAQCFEHDCDKYLVFNSVSSADRSGLGWAKKLNTQNASATAGNNWESIRVKKLQTDPSCMVIDLSLKKRLCDTVNELKGLNVQNKPIYLYQSCLSATHSFKNTYLSQIGYRTQFELSDKFYPDFIRADYMPENGKYLLTVIDAKNASFLKKGALIQIALYVKVLKDIVKDHAISNCIVNESEGIVWNREPITNNCLQHAFELKPAFDELDKFFKTKLPAICKSIDSCTNGTEIQEVLDYSISQECEYCGNFDTCKALCCAKRNVRMIPYLSSSAQNRIKELIKSRDLSDDSFNSVKDLLTRQPDLLTNDCSFWNTVKNEADAYEKGLIAYYDGKKERFPKNGTSISMPKSQNFSLYLTAQQDTNSGRSYAYAWLLKPGKDIRLYEDDKPTETGYLPIHEGNGQGRYYASFVAETDSPSEFARIDKEFIESIYGLLEKIDSYSNDINNRKLQCFVMDDYEHINLETSLFHMLDYLNPQKDQVLIDKIMAILFWMMQGDRLVTDSQQQPGTIVDNPIVVLTSELSRLYVLSEGVSYGLKDIASVFSPAYNFASDTYYFGILTNVIDGTHINSVWNENDPAKKNSKIESLAKHLRKRLFVESNIVSVIQDDSRKNIIQLNAWPERFRLLKTDYPGDPEVSRLDFENKYEQLLKYHQILSSRAQGIDKAIDNGTILKLRYTGTGIRYDILNHASYIGREWFTAWICEDTPENRAQIILLRDAVFKKSLRSPKIQIRNTNTVFYPIQNLSFDDLGTSASAEFTTDPRSTFQPQKDRDYLLFEVYSDYNSPKTAEGIRNLTTRPDLLDPNRLSSDTGITFDSSVEKACAQFWSLDGHTFSPSQKDAFKHFMERRLTVLVGPPASGKTDFIARSLITMASYYKTVEKKKLKIMVTAMSHSAIENVLLKTDKMLKGGNPCDIKVYKAKEFNDKKAFKGKDVGIMTESCIVNDLKKDEIQIVGMTSWTAYKAFHKDQALFEFDMIVMDEASQIRAMDSFLNLECSNENTRFLLVGDDNQLPPIIVGNYKGVPGQKYIHGSIFRMYCTGLGDGHQDIVKLSDNFRMNGILCKYPSKKIYGPTYKAYTTAIEEQKIQLKAASKDSLVDFILDAEYPLVLCELSGIAKNQTEKEIEVVTRLVRELWDNMQNDTTGNLAKDDGNFWRDVMKSGKTLDGACGIISPHHEHINRVRTTIAKDLSIKNDDVFIGTVDTLQGKERKAVIVSYGVSESEKIKNESEFIFSRNRFNVSITRGKAKTVVFLSDAIAEPNLTTTTMTANDEVMGKGIEFIHGFAEYMKDSKEDCHDHKVFVEGNVTLSVWKKKLK